MPRRDKRRKRVFEQGRTKQGRFTSSGRSDVNISSVAPSIGSESDEYGENEVDWGNEGEFIEFEVIESSDSESIVGEQDETRDVNVVLKPSANNGSHIKTAGGMLGNNAGFAPVGERQQRW